MSKDDESGGPLSRTTDGGQRSTPSSTCATGARAGATVWSTPARREAGRCPVWRTTSWTSSPTTSWDARNTLVVHTPDPTQTAATTTTQSGAAHMATSSRLDCDRRWNEHAAGLAVGLPGSRPLASRTVRPARRSALSNVGTHMYRWLLKRSHLEIRGGGQRSSAQLG